MGWQMWLTGLGGLLALVGQWWGMTWYLPAIGGVLALVAFFGMMSK